MWICSLDAGLLARLMVGWAVLGWARLGRARARAGYESQSEIHAGAPLRTTCDDVGGFYPALGHEKRVPQGLHLWDNGSC